MSRPLRLEFEGAIWHITSRGNERRDIYRDRNDRFLFLELLGETVEDAGWILHAYVLMSNHYHLLVETPKKTLSDGMMALNGRYAQRFNRRWGRVGHLVQGRFKAILVERETHLLELTRYIVLNPVRAGLVKFAADFEWSSYHATAGLDEAQPWLEVPWTLGQFDPYDVTNARKRYRQWVADAKGSSYNRWEALVGEIFLGGPAFCERMQALVSSQKRSGEHPRAQRQFRNPELQDVVRLVCHAFDETEESLRNRSRRPGRKALAHLARDAANLRIESVSEWLGTSISAASKLARTGMRLESQDNEYRSNVRAIRQNLKLNSQT